MSLVQAITSPTPSPLQSTTTPTYAIVQPNTTTNFTPVQYTTAESSHTSVEDQDIEEEISIEKPDVLPQENIHQDHQRSVEYTIAQDPEHSLKEDPQRNNVDDTVCPSKEIQEDLASSSGNGQGSLLKKNSPMSSLHDLISHNPSDENMMPLTEIVDDNGELVDTEERRLSPVKMDDVSPKSVAKSGKKDMTAFKTDLDSCDCI
ncbi:hypothetical protein K7X08_033844 [Anisodus acutangulus]|uniref:Uncharacterized protein n=1 Tax=Anisodus acutangulus TaxID=402998 RepID=A0A9Q1M3X5_9SOLA|nr:hypothetical protein K7X08_033844 [Anisodus acutangulus]